MFILYVQDQRIHEHIIDSPTCVAVCRYSTPIDHDDLRHDVFSDTAPSETCEIWCVYVQVYVHSI